MYIIFSIVFFILLNAYSNQNITSRELAINVLIYTATLLFIRLIRYRFIPVITHRKRNRNTVMIVEKAVDTSIPQVNTGGGGNSKINLNMNDKNSESQIQKKMSSLALNK